MEAFGPEPSLGVLLDCEKESLLWEPLASPAHTLPPTYTPAPGSEPQMAGREEGQRTQNYTIIIPLNSHCLDYEPSSQRYLQRKYQSEGVGLCKMWAVIRICIQRKMTIVKTLYAT